MEMNFAYHVNAHFAEVEATVRTNNPTIAIKEFLGHVEDGTHCDIVSGVTGEVLAIANCEDQADYATDEMALMVLGYLYATENQPAEPPAVEEYPQEEEMSLADFLDDLVAKGMATKLGGLPS
jgi:hypothetical protein